MSAVLNDLIPTNTGAERKKRPNLEWRNLTDTVSLGIKADINRAKSGVDSVYS